MNQFLSRREVFRSAGAAGIALGLEPMLGRLGFAAAADGKLLVIVHLRGGCDGLNLISPATDADFIAARASALRVAADGPEAGHLLAHGPDPKTEFRLHAAAGGLAELYQDGHLAVIHASGLTDGTRSHFVATDMIEHGVAGEAALGREISGWLARYAKAAGITGEACGISAASGPSGEFLAAPAALAVPDLGGGFGVAGGPPVAAGLAAMYRNAPGPVGGAGRDALSAVALLDGRIARDPNNHPLAYAPERNAKYDQAGDLGRALKTVAQIAKMEVGLSLATADVGGWDTHENQPGRFRNCVERLNNGIAAFWEDMWRYHDRLTVVTVSEFGRRLRSNRSNGTDHGRAGVMMALGGKITGGRCYGAWPGLHSSQLDEGVDLAVTTDYRQVFTEVLRAHRPQARLDAVFPGFRPGARLGLAA